MLRSLDEDRKYLMYIEASQVAHAAWAGAELYRRNLGDDIEFGEFVGLEGWRAALGMCWWVLHAPFAEAIRWWGIVSDYPGTDRGLGAQAALDRLVSEDIPNDGQGARASPRLPTDP